VWGGGAINYVMNTIDSVFRGMAGTPTATGVQSVYGTHWTDTFPSTTTGFVRLMMNEPTASSAAQMAITAGTPVFTAGGQIAMPTTGDQVIATMDYFAIGHTSLANIAPTLTGTLTGNMSYEFQYDFGSGWNGSWLTLDAATLSGTGAITPVAGFKIKIRVTTVTPDPTNALTSIRIDTVTDAVSQLLPYPYKTDALVSVSPIVSGSHIQLYNVTKATELYNGIPGISLAYEYYNGIEISSGDTIRLRVRKNGKEDVELNTTATNTGSSFLVSQEVDPHCTGATISNYSVDFVNKKIRATGSRDAFTCQEVADIICTEEATTDGIRLVPFAAITGLVTLSSGVQTGLTVNLIDWQVSWGAGSVAQAFITDGNLVGGIANDPVEDISGGPQVTINLSAAATVITTNVPTATDIATAVWANLNRTLTQGTRDAVIDGISSNAKLIPALL